MVSEDLQAITEYLASAPQPQRGTLHALRATVRGVLPDAMEKMSYGLPAFEVDGTTVAGYGWFKNHCSYFPHSGAVLERLSGELEVYDWSKGTLKFPIDEPLSKPLVKRLVEERLKI